MNYVYFISDRYFIIYSEIGGGIEFTLYEKNDPTKLLDDIYFNELRKVYSGIASNTDNMVRISMKAIADYYSEVGGC